jgi:tRNA threonylcarbamoyladenosine biosynthesis protein TsaB
MLSLAIDTSAHLCSAALHDDRDDRMLGEISLDIGRGHAERLMDLIAGLLGECGLDYTAIGRIFCAAGPGSFTGVRIGLAAARGLALALDRPVYGLNVLEALAEAAIPRDQRQENRPLLTALDARRGEAYCQYFGAPANGAASPFLARYDSDERIARILGQPNLALCGSGAPILAARADCEASILHELSAAPIAVLCRIGTNRPSARQAPEPIYLRGADAKPQAAAVLARR